MRKRKLGFALAIPAWAWLIMFFVLPVAVVVYYSFGYKPGMFGTHANDKMSFDRYLEVFTPTFFDTFMNTLWIGIAGTAICFVIAMPMAYWMALKAPPSLKAVLIALVLIPFWTNFLVRTIGWQVLLAPEGIISNFMQSIGFDPLQVLNTRGAVLLGVVYNYLPLMILPLFVALDRVDLPMREAAKDLGAGPVRTFARVTLPLALPGIIVGAVLVFIPLMGDYITATVLGGAKGNMIGQMVAVQFQTAQNWALGSAMAVVLILVILASIVVLGALLWLITLPVRRAWSLKLEEVPA